MFYIACTRFNNLTYEENIEYRVNHNEPAIYGVSLKIRTVYSPNSLIFIAEMNNEKNKIEGIGLIRNNLVCDQRYKIYNNDEYNRYIYRGNYWLSREKIDEIDTEIGQKFDLILFKGKTNLKNRTGITILSKKIFMRWNYDFIDFKNKIKRLFLNYFKKDTGLDEKLIDIGDFEEELQDEEFEIIPIKGKGKEKGKEREGKINCVS